MTTCENVFVLRKYILKLLIEILMSIICSRVSTKTTLFIKSIPFIHIFCGFSTLWSTTVPSMKQKIPEIKKSASLKNAPLQQHDITLCHSVLSIPLQSNPRRESLASFISHLHCTHFPSVRHSVAVLLFKSTVATSQCLCSMDSDLT